MCEGVPIWGQNVSELIISWRGHFEVVLFISRGFGTGSMLWIQRRTSYLLLFHKTNQGNNSETGSNQQRSGCMYHVLETVYHAVVVAHTILLWNLLVHHRTCTKLSISTLPDVVKSSVSCCTPLALLSKTHVWRVKNGWLSNQPLHLV